MKTQSLIKIVTVGVAGILFSTTLNAASTYTAKMTTLMNKAGNIVGTITPGTKLDIIEESGKNTKVRVRGWSAFGAESVIFKQVGKRIILGILDESVVSKVKKGKSKTDEFESIWNESSFIGWVKTSNLDTHQEKKSGIKQTNYFNNVVEVVINHIPPLKSSLQINGLIL